MPESSVPINIGQAASAEDGHDASVVSINWMADSSGNCLQRPGISNAELDPLTYAATTGTGTGIIGLYVWKSAFNQRDYLVYVRSDRTIWTKDLITNVVTALSDGTAATRLDGAATSVIFAEDSQRLNIAGGGQLQLWNGNTTSLSARNSAYVFGVNQPPLSATHVVGIANYLVANQNALPGTSSQIFWTGLGDSNHTTWNPLNFNTADADPDAIVAIAGNLREVFAFGTKTMQVFGIGSDPLVPFTASRAIAVGCSAAYSVIRSDDRFCWLDGTRQFVISDGGSVEYIGDPVVKTIRDMATVSDCAGFRARLAYWDLYVWVFPTEGKAFAYDYGSKRWLQWRGWNGTDAYSALRISSYAYWPANNLHIVGDPLFENLWTLDPDSRTDSGPGMPIVCELVTPRLNYDYSDRKLCKKVRLFLKRGETDQPSTLPAYLDVAKKDDDGPWSGGKQIDLGIAGDYSSVADWRPGGIYRRRQYRLRYSGSVPMSISKMVEFWEPLEG